MTSIPKKIFSPLHYQFPPNTDANLEKIKSSKYQNHFIHMINSKESDFSQYYIAEICPAIAFRNLLIELEKEKTIEIFIQLFINSLPDIIEISPLDILESVISNSIIQESTNYLSTVKLSLLCCRLASKCSFAALTCILKDSHSYVKNSTSRIVASFLHKLLISFSQLSENQKMKMQTNANTDDSISFIPGFYEEFNKFISLIFQYHVNVLSLRTISYMMQEFVDELDIMSPSPSCFIQNPDRCSINSAFTISLILGQAHISLLNLTEKAKKLLCKLSVLSPLQVRDCLIYLTDKNRSYNSSDILIVSLISYNNPSFMSKKREVLMWNQEYLNNEVYKFMSKFGTMISNTQSILEMAQFFYFMKSNSLEGQLDPLGVIATVTKLIDAFPILLGNFEYDKFILLASALCSLSHMMMRLFGASHYSKLPILHYLDVLLVSPFSTTPKPLTYPVEIIESCIESINSIILDDFEEWFEFIFDQPQPQIQQIQLQQQMQQQQMQQLQQQMQMKQFPMFANLHVLSLIIHEKNNLNSTFQMIKEKVQDIIMQSALLLQTLSFKALNDVACVWIDIVSFFVLFDLNEAARFAYLTLRLLFSCLSEFHSNMNEECSCYILQLLERLILCPFYQFTVCAYEQMVAMLISFDPHERKDSDILNNSQSDFYQVMHFFLKIFDKNGTNYEVNAMFGLPNYQSILQIAQMCVSCLISNKYEEISNLSAELLARMIENKYCRAIIQNVVKKVPRNFVLDEVEEEEGLTVLELQSKIDEIVPNRVKKIELGFLMWKQNFDNGTPIDVMMHFAHKNIFM